MADGAGLGNLLNIAERSFSRDRKLRRILEKWVTRDFPGGNGELVAYDDTRSTLVIRPEQKGGSPHRGWFYVQLHNLAPGRAAAEGVVIHDFWTSEAGRCGKLFAIGNAAAARRVWITARMHAFEAVSSWVAEGLIRWALSADPDAQ